MADRIDDLPRIHQACWDELSRAASDKGHAWRMMALATVAAPAPADDGAAPMADLRSVVLREVNAQERTLMFFTDARSPKVAQITVQPAATLLMWCPQLSWQLRLRAQLVVERSGLAVSSRWARLKMKPAANDYLSPLPPGTPLAHPRPERGTREHFAVVQARVQAIDWLELHPDGQRRAVFDGDGRGQWLTP
ncbi:MAG: hypothetical protein A3E25_10270 [Burkholderiales bacterium RIFCSPHIGHO2_12_FULL_69_20]|nr:MAG: hypothetical protein A3E25_10270 [Burkholderiales bacterium RIFCSPHIGHO2_12_FULL_69_20]